MELSTFHKIYDFKMPMVYMEKNHFNNKEALKNRFCFILIEKGAGIINLNKKNVPFIAPVIFCINENENIYIDKELNIKIKTIYFHPSIINGILDFENIRSMPEEFLLSTIQDCEYMKPFTQHNDKFYGKINIGPLTSKRLSCICESFKKESTLQNTDNWPCRSRSYIMEILFLIQNAYSESYIQNETVISEDDEEIKSIITYLINNYDKNITISELTKLFSINRTTLSSKFNESIGESIISYLNRTRINMASIILRDTKLPISEVMTRVGFNESTHFLRTFKKYTGMSPKSYRDNYCWMN
ncbi:helix-turn-helix domain-containing protein [Clostridium chromiireducens]|uniref:Helix-turn-helix domain-containing protein n=1 Tax=Clostridium chromiireducens TaxID=225345 RepID=A0A964RLX6_9CLOT|nr:AraC family transcriptional regulator [Clostridium chromiireducens]MVX64007.1 helix-turn-helix domain-containing protein [Clostridium chromiireducens]